MKRGKNYQDSLKLYDKTTQYDPAEALDICLKTAKAKFDIIERSQLFQSNRVAEGEIVCCQNSTFHTSISQCFQSLQ